MKQEELERQNELEHIYRAACGDHEAFRQLVIFYEPRLLAYLTHMLGNSENARDIAQDTFVAAFRGLPLWHPPDDYIDTGQKQTWGEGTTQTYRGLLTPWLYRIATNRALNFLKREPVHTRFEHEDPHNFNQSSEPGNRELAAAGMSLEERFAIRELLKTALRNLPEEDAACLVLRFVAKESYREIADRLGLSPEAVRKRVSRGLTVLRTTYMTLEREALR